MAVEVIVWIAVVAVVALVVHAAFFSKPEKPDPTKARIPDHMKTGIAWKDPDMYDLRKKRREKRRRGGS